MASKTAIFYIKCPDFSSQFNKKSMVWVTDLTVDDFDEVCSSILATVTDLQTDNYVGDSIV